MLNERDRIDQQNKFLLNLRATLDEHTAKAVIAEIIACSREATRFMEIQYTAIGSKYHLFAFLVKNADSKVSISGRWAISKRNGISRMQVEDNVSEQEATIATAKDRYKSFTCQPDVQDNIEMQEALRCFEKVFWRAHHTATKSTRGLPPHGNLTYSRYVRRHQNYRSETDEEVFAFKLRRTGCGFDVIAEIGIRN